MEKIDTLLQCCKICFTAELDNNGQIFRPVSSENTRSRRPRTTSDERKSRVKHHASQKQRLVSLPSATSPMEILYILPKAHCSALNQTILYFQVYEHVLYGTNSEVCTVHVPSNTKQVSEEAYITGTEMIS